MDSLRGKVAIVTGGSRGLGLEICKVLGEAGLHIISVDIRDDLNQELERLMKAQGFDFWALNLDVSDQDQVQQGLERARKRYNKIDILINNAGIDKTVPIEDMGVSDWDRIVGVNLRGAFLMSKYTLPIMKQQKSGHIINVASTAAKRAWANASAYHASKWGLLGFSHALHVEARQVNIKVTAVVTGGMRTPFLLDRFPDIDVATLQNPRNVAETIKYVLTQPEETVIPEIMVIPMRETSWP